MMSNISNPPPLPSPSRSVEGVFLCQLILNTSLMRSVLHFVFHRDYQETHVLFTLFVFVCVQWCRTHVVLCIVLFIYVLCTLYCQFLWIVPFLLPRRYSLWLIVYGICLINTEFVYYDKRKECIELTKLLISKHMTYQCDYGVFPSILFSSLVS